MFKRQTSRTTWVFRSSEIDKIDTVFWNILLCSLLLPQNKGPAQHAAMSSVLGDHGIFVSDGPVWKAQRKLASNIFSVSRFRNHVQETVQGDLTTLHTLMERSSKTGQQIDLQDVFFRYTLSSFATMAFSTSIGCLPWVSQLSNLVDSVTTFVSHFISHLSTLPLAPLSLLSQFWSGWARHLYTLCCGFRFRSAGDGPQTYKSNGQGDWAMVSRRASNEKSDQSSRRLLFQDDWR